MAFHVTSNSAFDKGRYVIQIEWTKALSNNCHPCLNYSIKVKGVYQKSRNQTVVFRTLIVRWHNPV